MFEISTNVPKIIIIPIHPTQTAILTHGSKRHQLTPAKRHQRFTHSKQISPLTIPLRDGFKTQYQYQHRIPQTTSSAALAAGATAKKHGKYGNSTNRNAFFKLPPILERLHFFSLPTPDLAPPQKGCPVPWLLLRKKNKKSRSGFGAKKKRLNGIAGLRWWFRAIL